MLVHLQIFDFRRLAVPCELMMTPGPDWESRTIEGHAGPRA